MTTEPKMPQMPEWSKRDDLGGLVPSEIRAFITERDQQWAERVAELERMLGVARDALVAASDLYRTGLIYASDELIESVPRLRDEAISTIDAARSKEGQHHD